MEICKLQKNLWIKKDLLFRELSTEIQEALLAEEEKNQIQRKYEKELSAKTCKIEELQYKLSELENELEDVRFENKELSKNAKIPSISKVPSISSRASKELSQKSESGMIWVLSFEKFLFLKN